jgi:hypothetical protein
LATNGSVARLWRWLWRRLPVAPERLPDGDSARAAARARFWADLREGQREAAAHQAPSAIRDDVGARSRFEV